MARSSPAARSRSAVSTRSCWRGTISTPSATTSIASGSATRCCTRSARRRSCWRRRSRPPLLPIFLDLTALHLIGSFLSVILPFSFFPFGVYLAYLYYATAIPRDLLDAARVDGAGEWQTFRRGGLPLAQP